MKLKFFPNLKNTQKLKLTYNTVQNETNSMLEIKFMKLKKNQKEIQTNLELKFTYNPVKNEANSN